VALRWARQGPWRGLARQFARGRTVGIVEVRFFGEFEVLDGGVQVPVRGTKQRALLAMLALRRGNPVSADRLIDVLWGDSQVANPANALQAQIGQLRRTLGARAIVTSEAGYALAVGPDDLDAARFERLVADGRRLSEEGEPGLASTVLSEALRLRRGEPLVEFDYAGFAEAERAHLDELALVATEGPCSRRPGARPARGACRRAGGAVPGTSAPRAPVGAAHPGPVPERTAGRGLAGLHGNP